MPFLKALVLSEYTWLQVPCSALLLEVNNNFSHKTGLSSKTYRKSYDKNKKLLMIVVRLSIIVVGIQ